MYVGNNNTDQLRVKAGISNLNIEANQPLSTLYTQVVKTDPSSINIAEVQAQFEMQKSLLRANEKKAKLEQFQQTISERAAIIQKANKLKKQEDDRVKEEKKNILLSKNKRPNLDMTNDSFFAQPQKQPTPAVVAATTANDKLKKTNLQNSKPSVSFKPNEVAPEQPKQRSQPSKIPSSNQSRQHQGRAQILIPVVADEENQSEDEDEIDFDICNFADAEEALSKYADIRQHLFELTSHKSK